MSEPSVAVLGASRDRRKYGNKAVRAYVESGYTVYPVNPKEEAIEGLKAYPALDKIEGPVDFVSLYVPPAVGLLRHAVTPETRERATPTVAT